MSKIHDICILIDVNILWVSIREYNLSLHYYELKIFAYGSSVFLLRLIVLPLYSIAQPSFLKTPLVYDSNLFLSNVLRTLSRLAHAHGNTTLTESTLAYNSLSKKSDLMSLYLAVLLIDSLFQIPNVTNIEKNY